MNWTFTPAEAELVFGFIASVIVPFIVSWLKRCAWPKYTKLLLTIGVSLVAALVSQYAAGSLSGGSVIVAAIGVFTAGQVHFASWFRGLGLDDVFNPEQAGLLVVGTDTRFEMASENQEATRQFVRDVIQEEFQRAERSTR